VEGYINIVIADAEDIESIGESFRPVEDWTGLEVQGIDPPKLATLHSMLTGESFDEAIADFYCVYAASDEGPWVIQAPDVLIGKLAELEEQALEEIGEELAATEEFEMAGWPVEEVQNLLGELVQLANAALEQGFTMLVWMSPEVD